MVVGSTQITNLMNLWRSSINLTNLMAVVVSLEISCIHSLSTHKAKTMFALPWNLEFTIGLLFPQGSQEYAVFTDIE